MPPALAASREEAPRTGEAFLLLRAQREEWGVVCSDVAKMTAAARARWVSCMTFPSHRITVWTPEVIGWGRSDLAL